MSGMLSRRAFFTRPSHRPEMSEAAGLSVGVRNVAVLGTGCLAVNGVMCGICSDPCEPRALRVRPLGGGRALPIIDAEACTACGECISVCPVGALALAPLENSPCA